jgi:hypothetical protein
MELCEAPGPADTTVDVKVTECNTGDVPLSDVKVEITSDAPMDPIVTLGYGLGMIPPTKETSPTGTPGILDVGECWEWDCGSVTLPLDMGPLDVTRKFTAIGFGTTPPFPPTYPDGLVITWVPGLEPGVPGYNEKAELTVDQERPGTEVTVVSVPAAGATLKALDPIAFTVKECNKGNIPLYNVAVAWENNKGGTAEYASGTLDASTAIESMTDDDILEVGECWTWEFSGAMTLTDVCFDFYGTGTTRPLSTDTGYMVIDSKYDAREHKQVCFKASKEGFTRTPGYWQTHKCMVEWLVPYAYPTPPGMLIINCDGTVNDGYVTSWQQAMGLLWCPRSDSWAAQLGRMLVCAQLNVAVPGHLEWAPGGYASVEDLIKAGQVALCNGDRETATKISGYLDIYNNRGDFGEFPNYAPWVKAGKDDCRFKGQGTLGKDLADWKWCTYLAEHFPK